MSEIKTQEEAKNYINSVLSDISSVKDSLIQSDESSLISFSFNFGVVYYKILNNLISLQEYFTDQINSNGDSNVTRLRDNSKTPVIETK